jgi:hypothetical protein
MVFRVDALGHLYPLKVPKSVLYMIEYHSLGFVHNLSPDVCPSLSSVLCPAVCLSVVPSYWNCASDMDSRPPILCRYCPCQGGRHQSRRHQSRGPSVAEVRAGAPSSKGANGLRAATWSHRSFVHKRHPARRIHGSARCAMHSHIPSATSISSTACTQCTSWCSDQGAICDDRAGAAALEVSEECIILRTTYVGIMGIPT